MNFAATSHHAKTKQHTNPIKQVLQKMTDMQLEWMDQVRVSQEREERLINNIMHSNSQMVAALMEGIRGLQNSKAPQQGHEFDSAPRYYNIFTFNNFAISAS